VTVSIGDDCYVWRGDALHRHPAGDPAGAAERIAADARRL
jgi:hypothetical protein